MGYGVVQSPTFNLKQFPVGKSLRIRSNDRKDFYGFDYDVLVVRCSPLQLEVAYINQDKLNVTSVVNKIIPIGVVADGDIEIYELDTMVAQIKSRD